MPLFSSIALGVLAATSVGLGVAGAIGQADAAKKAEREQEAAKKQMESDIHNRTSQQSMGMLRQRILAGRLRGGSGGGLGSVGGAGGAPASAPAQKTALGA